jgi:SAM-dependent methyltransferase
MGEHEPQDPIALACYEAMATKYAEVVDQKPYNALYERPAVLKLLPPLQGLDVFDAGCGSGWYAEYLVEQGAQVVSVDVSPKFVAMTRARLGDRAEVRRADLGQPLAFIKDGRFDLIVAPLVMHYLEDWAAVFAEFHRILKRGGQLVFSTHHPFMDYRLHDLDDYFEFRLLEEEWSTGKVRFYRRPLTAMSAALKEAGFVIERLLEPQPVAAFQEVDPEGYEKLSKNPWFLVIRARREG